MTGDALHPPPLAPAREGAPGVLAAVAGELGQLAALTARIEAALGATLPCQVDPKPGDPGAASSTQTTMDLQRIDLLRQYLEELSAFLGGLAEQCAPDAFGDDALRFPFTLKALEERVVKGIEPTVGARSGDGDITLL